MAVRNWTQNNGLGIIGLIEPRLGVNSISEKIGGMGLQGWNFVDSESHPPRLLVGWDVGKYNLQVIDKSPQWITCAVTGVGAQTTVTITFVYGHNKPTDRQALWAHLQDQSSANLNRPWAILGDFNAILSHADRAGGSLQWSTYMEDFPTCLQRAGLIVVPYTGLRYTWHNGRRDGQAIQRKLDWVLGNQALLDQWPNAHATFLPRIESDHSPMVLRFMDCHQSSRPPKAFRFLNLWTERDDFMDLVRDNWANRIQGNPFFILTSKLQILKGVLNRYHRKTTSHISSRVIEARRKWVAGQVEVDKNPMNQNLHQQERHLADDYHRLSGGQEYCIFPPVFEEQAA
ncbi:hypothetical protein OIU84_013079 [Salix udensis]|uniref:Endonuclease/exonuclease/phosphatase domain-containing protein n=1 Tax=Salix udensis TaxID=889485 RepID=A0AAD6JJ56_9ROSI|nr:hypothetical protein OIU84_013079 [Salix udensis]